MKERPIIFNAQMVRALLAGTKTQTRRIAKPVKHPDLGNVYAPGALVLEREPQHVIERACPYGQPGDRLWVRETYVELTSGYAYRADPIWHTDAWRWNPSIHMPRWASRITLEITSIRVERLQDIGRGDAMAEGCPFTNMAKGPNPRQWYADLWEQINGTDSWDLNPWVWVVEFKRVEGGAA